MSVATIRLFPDSQLREKAEIVRSFDSELAKMIELMDKTMRLQPSGIGIAAPQIGLSIQAAIVDVSARVPISKRLVLINPRLIEVRTKRLSQEGCMSIPEYTATIQRFDWVRIAYQDLKGKQRSLESQGIEAVCIQHEIDHLNGILFIDHVSSLKRDMIPRHKPHKA